MERLTGRGLVCGKADRGRQVCGKADMEDEGVERLTRERGRTSMWQG